MISSTLFNISAYSIGQGKLVQSPANCDSTNTIVAAEASYLVYEGSNIRWLIYKHFVYYAITEKSYLKHCAITFGQEIGWAVFPRHPHFNVTLSKTNITYVFIILVEYCIWNSHRRNNILQVQASFIALFWKNVREVEYIIIIFVV